MQNFELSFLLSYFIFETFKNSTIHSQIYHLNTLFGITSFLISKTIMFVTIKIYKSSMKCQESVAIFYVAVALQYSSNQQTDTNSGSTIILG